MIRRVVVDADLPPLGLGPDVEVVGPGPSLAIDGRTLVVTADEALLAAAGAAGGHRLVRSDDDTATVAAAVELIHELGRASDT